MKGAWEELVGQRITAVVTLEANREPQDRVVLLLANGSYFEVYSHGGSLKGTNRGYTGDLSVVLHHYRGENECTVYGGGSGGGES